VFELKRVIEKRKKDKVLGHKKKRLEAALLAENCG
jgi:hypothetical protein